jgi:VWFA-related protein
LLLAPLAQAQQPYVETFEVRLHNLDVVVTGSDGKPLRGLTRDDFVVLENEVEQEVTNFSAYDSDSVPAATPAEGGAEAKAAPRRFVFFLDELSLHPSSRAKLLKNITTLLQTSMGEGDVAAVVRPYGAKNVLLDYTGDKAVVEKAIRSALEASNTRANTQMAGEMHWLESQLADSSTVIEKNFAIRIYADTARRRIEQRLGQIRALVASLSGREGKKILVLVTASLAAQPGKEVFNLSDVKLTNNPEVDKELPGKIPGFPDLTPQINELARTAATNGVTIYALQPDVPLELAIPGGNAPRRQLTSIDPRTSRPMPPVHALSENFFGLVLDNTQLTIQSLAEKTGGRWYRGDGNVDDAFRQIGDDLRSYYSLAYRATGYADTPHRVEVRVKGRDGVHVRTRTEVMTKSSTREMDDLVVASLVYPRAVNELQIEATAGALTKVRGRFSVPVETRIPMDKLTFLPASDGKYHAVYSVHYGAIGERADFAAMHEQRQEVVVTAAELKALGGKQWRHHSDLVVAQGRVRIAVGVLDLISKQAGFVNLDLKAK